MTRFSSFGECFQISLKSSVCEFTNVVVVAERRILSLREQEGFRWRRIDRRRKEDRDRHGKRERCIHTYI